MIETGLKRTQVSDSSRLTRLKWAIQEMPEKAKKLGAGKCLKWVDLTHFNESRFEAAPRAEMLSPVVQGGYADADFSAA